MIKAIWSFLQNADNQKTLAMIGSALVVLVGGIWAVIKFRIEHRPDPAAKPAAKPQASADHGGIAIGGNSVNSTSTTHVNERGRD